MDLSDEQKRIDVHAFVKAQFDGNYSEAVAYLNALATLNRFAYDVTAGQFYSRKQGFIDFQRMNYDTAV